MTVLSLELYRSVPRYLAARAVGDRLPGLVAGPLAPLRLVNRPDPEPPADGWARVQPRLSGICGSDLATIEGRSSFYFSPLVSMPFVPGHEVVGDLLEDVDGLAAGTRVVLDPVLGCEARGLPPCPACTQGATGRCDRVTVGHVSPGLQTGYCADTGGGWSGSFVAHRSQLRAVPDGLSDERAVLVEPLACGIHAALRGRPGPGDAVLVVGAGTLGILTLLALRELTGAGRITVVAKHRKQADLARRFGATDVIGPGEALGSLRRSARAFRVKPERGPGYLLGGVDVAYECVGAPGGLDLALRTTRAGGRVVLTGLPVAGADLAPVWFRELEVLGAYASGTEDVEGVRRHSFDMAIELAAEVDLDGVVGATYPLGSWRQALDHAMSAGRLGTAKVTFDPRED
ncbi:MAG TPA: zinc-binding dehydrogenase [Actinomycetota bacterium]|nr:zinc-binding dehydrogenase [Actinomycetota bacterium]